MIVIFTYTCNTLFDEQAELNTTIFKQMTNKLDFNFVKVSAMVNIKLYVWCL